jgi:ribonuclease E
MLDDESTPTPDVTPEPGDTSEESTTAPATRSAKKTAAKKTTAKKATAKKAAAKKTTRKAAGKKAASAPEEAVPAPEEAAPATDAESAAAAEPAESAAPAEPAEPAAPAEPAEPAAETGPPAAALLFQAPEPSPAPPQPRTRRKKADEGAGTQADSPAPAESEPAPDRDEVDTDEGEAGQRRRRRRGGRRRRKNGDEAGDEAGEGAQDDTSQPAEPKGAQKGAEAKGAQKGADAKGADDDGGQDGGSSSSRRRRRRRRRQGEDDGGAPDDPANTVVRVREPRAVGDDEISGFTGSTRLEAKKQRRREGREAGRRRAPIVSEAEFLARREAVDRVMVVRQRDDVAQIGVLEDDVLVEHYVARESQTSLIGNVYLGRVQNVLPSMEAAFIDIGKGRNAVLYAGEVNWSLLGKEGQARRIETALKSGQTVLVQVTKDPVGHKGARLTSQISLPGRYLVYLPGGQTSGISRKLPDTERNRLKNLLKEVLPDEAGVIIRTAAEGASEDELRRDVTRLTARWDDIEQKVEKGQAPQLLYGEPDLMIKVVRDLFTEDFKKLVISGDDAWDMIEGYVSHVAPDLMDRVERWNGDDGDVFASYRLDEQIAKALERKVWLPSGGSLIIDRTEAMTVVDVNTGKFTGSGGNLEETVTKNNLEAAEEVVRQLRLRDIGGIIVVDFIDMVLESNRDLVLRRLVECLGRDRTRHQVAEVTSLGLVQMTRKRIGTGLLEAFSEPCESCGGRGLHTHMEPVEPRKAKQDDDSRRGGRRSRRGGDGDRQPDKGSDKPADKQPDKQSDKQGKQQEPKPGKGKGKDKRKEDKRKDQPAAESAPAESAPAESAPAESVPAESVPAESVPAAAAPAAQVRDGEAPAQPEPAATEPAETRPREAQADERAKAQPAETPAATPAEPAPARAQPAETPATPSADGRQPREATPGQEPSAPAADAGPGDAGSEAETPSRPARRTRRRAASRPAGPPEHSTADTH